MTNSKLSLCVFSLLLLTPLYTNATELHALVIGNSDYQSFALENPRNDVIDMAAQLKSMGYKIHTDGPLFDLDRVSMERSIDSFARKLPHGASAVFYYAGHGMATNSDNYLLPLKHNLESQAQLRDRAIGLRGIVDLLADYNSGGVNVFLLDACRNNPLTRSFRGMKRGLQRLNDVPRGVFIGYAAESGKVASDGMGGRNGTYTGQLLESMMENPNLSIEALHEVVANEVYKKTDGAQFPVSEDRVIGSWCFGSCGYDAGNKPIRDESIAQSEISKLEVKPKRNYWKIAGGVALGLVAIALVKDSFTDSSDPPPAGVPVTIVPPVQ